MRRHSRRFLAPLSKKRWFVYAKRPFAGPESRARLSVTVYAPRRHLEPWPDRSRTSGNVTFKVKDYRIEGPGRYTTMTLGRRRVHPPIPHPRAAQKDSNRIRHYGLFASRQTAPRRSARVRKTLGTCKRLRPQRAVEIDPAAAQALAQALPLLWRPHVRHRDLRCRLPTTLPADPQ